LWEFENFIIGEIINAKIRRKNEDIGLEDRLIDLWLGRHFIALLMSFFFLGGIY
jgi:hypothetical protein